MKVVVDTNVLVSAPLSPFHAPARVIDLILAGDITIVYDDRVMTEYREVLARPKFGFDMRATVDLLSYLEKTGVFVTASPLAVNLPDPDDVSFLEVAVASAAILVTGNLRHYPQEQCAGVVVLSPSQLIEKWQG